MYVIVDERPMVTDGYVANFNREGVTSVGLVADDFEGWIQSAPETDLDAVQGFLLGNCEQRPDLPEMIQKRSRAPIIAMIETRCLTETLDLFRAGIDDVVRKPVHVREILARTEAVWRRSQRERASDSVVADRTARLRVYFDGRDPDVDGEKMPLPRRERQILEFLVRNRGRRMTKEQVFNAVYGAFTSDVDESVIEGHISKLRKKLRQKLSFDPIEVRRYLGYAFVN
ncbi:MULTISPECIES: response regulator transcription factor [Methylobacterium]|jgi:DNA-binding response OmpR family regulator|uniref:DNA-binding response regulator, OmpR family, contains REC and winged-helix (WHTH) domain n=2 Tax=Methylobacterium TaxID=407 RepID=A0AAE8HMQ2_9HYPH|nr:MULTISPECIES: response regulator transcription factor [Methylobacterium]APT30626.1 flagellar transcriptional regulator FtcR [Methylobacterium phyllosphaerae]MBA9063325.1 DNA-binding response OmpR family regulator [Methylobacterium fujisawaense]MBP29950.1 DNA-binding response regulator [Methylobacterium sp.]MDH3027872.1 response regulator transcription factor [Methylobacterium fujisawaense]RUP12766.1 MAG: response regulator transcription factor [Methylobacterium sp.]